MEGHTTGDTESALVGTGSVLEWAIQFYCAADDDKMVTSLLQLRLDEANKDWDDLFQSYNEPLCLLFNRLNVCTYSLGPMYLGLEESEEALNRQQPWASPLNLQHMAKSSVSEHSKAQQQHKDAGSAGSSPARTTLEPFSSPFNSPPRSIQQSRQQPLEMWEIKALEVPAMIHWLITVENARRRFATEYLDWKHAQGSVGEQSERWQHHFAKRNIAAEIKFENILVALKEIVVLHAIITPGRALTGEMAALLDRLALQQHSQPQDESAQVIPSAGKQGVFDVAQCLAVLNLMFPLSLPHADARYSQKENKMRYQYAMTLRHVPSPRIQLLQLLCETEAWVNGDDRVTVSIGPGEAHSSTVPFSQLSQSADDHGDGLNGGLENGSVVDEHEIGQRNGKHAGDQDERTPANCPTWLAAARRFAWGQLKQSCFAYLRYAQHSINKQHFEMHQWKLSTPAAPDQPADEAAPAHDTQEPAPTCSKNQRITNAILSENDQLLREVQQHEKPGTTVLERIVRHSRLVKSRFSPYATYSALAK
ncbi:hypothetical protein H4R20_001797 [Coemansia guatemalensis]|uniref:Uncharacterized protein n=1 Tax=Coemansia guatemalensis TaxID=2761395 RepID=A0A9W8I3Q3_9FUNG|nr:hypothetical protein H4R20_001797 [Coemansia guatemalensis]